VPDQDHLPINTLNDIGNGVAVSVQGDSAIAWLLFAMAGQVRTQNRVTPGFQAGNQVLPACCIMPGAVNQDEAMLAQGQSLSLR